LREEKEKKGRGEKKEEKKRKRKEKYLCVKNMISKLYCLLLFGKKIKNNNYIN
jgi:hypothetical protein